MAELRPIARDLAAFCGQVVGLFWPMTFAAAMLGKDDVFTGTSDYLGAVLFWWLSSVLVALIFPLAHAWLLGLALHWWGREHARAVSIAIALAMIPLLLADRIMRTMALWWCAPAVLLLGAYGWARGGFAATGGEGTRGDRILERSGVAITGAYLAATVFIFAKAWIDVLL